MTILTPLIAQALGRSPYDDEVWHMAGHSTPDETTQRYQQQYDQRGRPVNPGTRRINRDIIRAHNEVMLAIGVVEPEASWQETLDKQQSAKRHRQAETLIARRLLFVNGVIEKGLVWLVSGMRQQIMIFKDYAALRPDHLLHVTARSWKPYLLAGLPSYIMSNLYEYMWLPDMLDSPTFDYFITYLRLHLEIFSFLQRIGLGPTDTFLPTWRFFLPGTSISPLPIPPVPSSLTTSSAVGWLGSFAVGLAPFAGFYLWKRYSIQLADILKYKFHSLIPAPVNRKRWHRAPLGDVTSHYYPEGEGGLPHPGEGVMENGLPEDPNFPLHGHRGTEGFDGSGPTEAAAFPVGTVQQRRQSTVSGTTRPGGGGGGGGGGHGSGQDDEFASDDEGENEMVRAAIISIEVGPAEPNPSNNAPGNGIGNNDVLGEIRPHREDNKSDTVPHDPVYRENTFTLLPSFFAASILGLSTFRLVSTPWEAFTLSSIAGLYASKQSTAAASWGLYSLMNGLTLRGLFTPWRRWESTLALELMLFNGVSWASLGLTWILFRSKVSDEEWEEREKKEKKRIEVQDEEGEQIRDRGQGQGQRDQQEQEQHQPQQEGQTAV